MVGSKPSGRRSASCHKTGGVVDSPGQNKSKLYSGKEVRRMSDFEILSLVFVVIGLVLTAMKHNDENKKGRH